MAWGIVQHTKIIRWFIYLKQTSKVLSDEVTEIRLAKWSYRFLAWLIDFVIISAVSATVIAAATGGFEVNVQDGDIWSESTSYIPTSLLFFAYWSILEYRMGQSVGKKIFRLKMVNREGGAPDLKGVLISSFGKAFLLPLDVILGWIFTNKDRQRVFNRIGDTLVVKISDTTDGITYKKD